MICIYREIHIYKYITYPSVYVYISIHIVEGYILVSIGYKVKIWVRGVIIGVHTQDSISFIAVYLLMIGR
jgi:hypothetical protein